jgi:hypothetical protein
MMGRSMLTTEQDRASNFNTDDAQAENFEAFKIVNAIYKSVQQRSVERHFILSRSTNNKKLSSSSKSNKS